MRPWEAEHPWDQVLTGQAHALILLGPSTLEATAQTHVAFCGVLGKTNKQTKKLMYAGLVCVCSHSRDGS
jgi:hypothetical protein